MPAGRPSAYDPESHPRIIKSMCQLGAVDTEIAAALGIRVSTLNNWKGKHPEILESLAVGKEPADDRVERSLYQRAIGYSHPDVDIRTVANGNNGGSEIVKTPIMKHYPPDPKACIYWLNNRRKDKWKNNPDGDQAVDDMAAAIRALAERLPA